MKSNQTNRLTILEGHLKSKFSFTYQDSLDQYRQRGMPLHGPELIRWFNEPDSDYIFQQLTYASSSPLFDHVQLMRMSRDERRDIALKQIIALATRIPITRAVTQKVPVRKTSLLSILSKFETGVGARGAVHYCLYSDALEILGTEKHLNLVDRALSLQDYGCFCMTELGHGSNLESCETTATYIHETREFVINSPTYTAAKIWIGALAKTANMGIIWAKLIVNGEDCGILPFVAQIRDYHTHETLPGIRVGDMGEKLGVNAIDNGFALFENFRIPYDALLDKLQHIDENGVFHASIKNKSRRLGVQLAAMLRGRLINMQSSIDNAHKALMIAIRYGAVRKQFSVGGTEELPILDYQLHRYRLMPHLARTVALNAFRQKMYKLQTIADPVLKENPESMIGTMIHVMLSVAKPQFSWYGLEAVQESREACGGLGYSAYSMFGDIKASQDINVTWEGDNGIFYRPTGKFLIKQLQNLTRGQEVDLEEFNYLSADFEGVAKNKATFGSLEELGIQQLFDILEQKVNILLHMTAQKMQSQFKKSKNMTIAENNSLVFGLKDLALAAGDVMYARALEQSIEALDDPNNYAYMSKLLKLYMAYTVEKSSAILMRGYLNAQQVDMVKEEVLRLCDEVGEGSVRLMDALYIPDNLLGSVLAQGDGQVYKNFMQAIEDEPGCYEKPQWAMDFVRSRNSGISKQQ